MKSYLKNYKIKLKTLAPVFIGSGKSISKREYVCDGKRVYVADEKKLIDVIIKKNLINSYLDSMKLRSFNLKTWLDNNGIRDYKSISSYTLSGIENIDINRSQKGINACIKNAYNQPYIPGSSLKGALRTVILWNKIYDYDSPGKIRNNADYYLTEDDRRIKNNLSLNKIRSEANYYLTRDDKHIKNNLAKTSAILERKFFNKNIEDSNCSIMRGLSISDSAPLSLDSVVLCEKIDISVNSKEKKPNILRECVKPGTDIEFTMTIDSSIFDCTGDDLDDMIKNYAADYFDIVTCNFANGDDDENALFLGGGSGYFSKTVTYRLFDYYKAVSFVRSYLSKTTSRDHMHSKDTKISPHMQKCTRCGGKLYEMGKCRIEIEEIT